MKEFIVTMFSGGSEVSSKRVNGTVGFIACTVSICCVNPQYLPLLLGASTALFVAGLFDNKNKPTE